MQVKAIDVKSNYVKNIKIGATPIKPQSFGHDDEAENNNSTKKAVLIGGAVLAAAVAAYFMFRKGKTPNVETPKPTPTPTPKSDGLPKERLQTLMNTRNDREVQQMYLLQQYGAPKQAQGQKLLTWDGKIGDTMLGEFSPMQIREGLPRVAKNGVKRPTEIFTEPYVLTREEGLLNGSVYEEYRRKDSGSLGYIVLLKDGNIRQIKQFKGNIGTLSNFDKSGLIKYKKIIEFDPAIKGKVVSITEIFDDGIQRSKIL